VASTGRVIIKDVTDAAATSESTIPLVEHVASPDHANIASSQAYNVSLHKITYTVHKQTIQAYTLRR